MTSTMARSLKMILLSLCLCVSAVNIPAQQWKTVADGVEYAEVRREFSGKPVNINLLRLDLKKVRLDVHHAMDAAIGTEKTSSIATRHKAFAAINAGFFRLDTSIWAGDSSGFVMIDGKVLSENINDHTVLVIGNEPEGTNIEFTPVRTFMFFRVGIRDVKISGMNREVKDDEIVLFTPEFHRTTMTGPYNFDVVVESDKIVYASTGRGSPNIPRNGYVLSASGARRNELESLLKMGDRVMLGGPRFEPVPGRTRVPIFSLKSVEDMVAGIPQLIKNSKIDITWEQEKSSKSFVETRHPRTAVAKLKDGKFLMLTADGRTEQSAGLDLYDLAAYILELGATDAMNLDGGGSTTMFLDGKVVNKPSDKEGERKVGDAILVTLRKPKKRN